MTTGLPGRHLGYLDTWCRANGATRSLVQLYSSAFTIEAIYGAASQYLTNPWELTTNTKGSASTKVRPSMVPSLWLVNFALIYTLNPALAADMPAYRAPIPAPVANAILTDPNGQVSYGDFESYFS